MRLFLFCGAVLLSTGVAEAQRTGSLYTTTKTRSTTPVVANPGGGSFSGGGGNCSTAVNVGTGPTVANFPYDNTTAASMGVATNPFEALCTWFGQTGIDNEEWFRWTATSSGIGRLSACSGILGIDTKVAIYADDCANITTLDPLACKDDSLLCPNLETIVSWEITAGASYLIQLGSFPGAPGGAGDFSIEELPVSPGQIDAGIAGNAFGTGGIQADWVWGHVYDAGAGETVNSVDISWGVIGDVLPPNGAATIAVYSGDPINGLTLLGTEAITTAQENTGNFVNYPLTTPVAVVGTYSVAVNYAIAAGPVFPAAIDDTTNSLGRAWNAIELTNFPVDLNNLAGMQLPPLDNDDPGSGDPFKGVWLLRSNTTPGGGSFASACFGDGGDQMGCTDCPCGNNAAAGSGGGCLNSAGTGATLLASGSPSVTAPDPTDLRFEMNGGVPSSFAVLTSGNAIAPANAANPCFAQNPGSGVQSAVLDGLRCAVQSTQRHGGRPVDANGDVGVLLNGWGGASGPPQGLAAQGGFIAGQTRHYQVFYRELPGQVCLTEQNTSQAVTVTFQP